MKHLAVLALLCAAAGCDKAPPPAPRKTDAQGEPNRIRVQHVLIAFRGTERADEKVIRSQDEAEVLAQDVLSRARRGEEFGQLMKAHSNDPGDGDYWLVNFGMVKQHSADNRRSEFAAGFCDVAFALKVGEIGLAPYDQTRSPFGYHIIKRLE